jgi:hypothetical protein
MSKRFHVAPDERVDIYEFEPDEIISDAAPNVITIRARMSVEIAGRVSNELARVGQDNKTEINLGAHTGALLLHNILGWSGPDFDDLPCTPANIASLPQPSSDPFIEKVVNAIGERNKKRTSPNGRSPATGSTSANAGAPDSIARPASDRPSLSLQLATGSSASPLRSAIIGRQNRSDD